MISIFSSMNRTLFSEKVKPHIVGANSEPKINILDEILFRFLHGCAYLLSLLPMRVLYGMASFGYIILLYVFSYRKIVVVQNISRSFPDKKYDEIQDVMREFYHCFTDNFAEILKMISIPFSKQAAKITLVNFDIISELLKLDKHVIASMGHCGNWEILNVLPGMLNINSYAVYKPLTVKMMDRFFLTLRSRFGLQLIPSKGVVRHFVSNKSNPSLYFFLADQCPKTVDEKYKFDFLCQETSALSGVEKLARSSGASVVYIHVVKTARGEYTAECKLLTSDSKATEEVEITRGYMSLLEENIQAKPGSWLWTHKRWKR